MWRRLASTTALVFAAALRRVREVQAQMDLQPRWAPAPAVCARVAVHARSRLCSDGARALMCVCVCDQNRLPTRRQTFQYFGLDFLVDSGLHPWLMEVNATPSMKVAHERPDTAALIHDQKWAFVRDAFRLLQATQHTLEEVRNRACADGRLLVADEAQPFDACTPTPAHTTPRAHRRRR